jgi:hypothetical protein
MKQQLIRSLFVISFLMFSGLVKPQGVNFGIKGGFTLSNLYIDSEELNDENARIGVHAGLFSQIMFADIFGIQPEFLFSQKGSEGKYTGIIDQTVNFKINYIDIPLLFVLRPVDVIELHAGPLFGILLNSNVEYSGIIDGVSEIDREHLKTLDYGLAAGFALNFGNLQAGVRYNMGLQKIADSETMRILVGDSKNSYGQIFLAIKFAGR